MTLGEFGELLTGIAALFAAVFSAIAHGEIKKVHIIVNSRLSELLKLTAKSSHAEGIKDEADRQDRQDRQDKE